MTTTLREWLKLQPVPHTLEVEYEEDEDKTVRIGDSRSKFRDAELACKGALRIEAFDKEGATLRVWEAPDAQTREAVVTVAQASGGAIDAMAMVTNVATIIADSNDRAVERHAEIFRMALDANNQLVAVMSERLAQFERLWQQSLIDRASELDERPETPPPPQPSQSEQLVTNLLTGVAMQAMQAASAPSPSPAPAPANGAQPAKA